MSASTGSDRRDGPTRGGREWLLAGLSVVVLVVVFAWWIVDGSTGGRAVPLPLSADGGAQGEFALRPPAPVEPATPTAVDVETLVVAGSDVQPATASESPGVVIRGRVMRDGAPVAEARVHLVPSGDVLRRMGLLHAELAWVGRLPSTTSGPAGAFRMRVDPSLLQRSHDARDVCRRFAHVVVSVPGCAPTPRRCLKPRNGVIDVGAVNLLPAPSLVGRVLACDGTPAADVHVAFEQKHRPRHPDGGICTDAFAPLRATRTGPDGRFALMTRAPGQGEFWYHRPGLGASERVALELYVGERDLGDLRYPCEGELSGRVVDEAGQPLPRARLMVSTVRPQHEAHDEHERAVLFFRDMARDAASSLELHADDDGRFVFHRVEPGVATTLYALTAGHQGRVLENVSGDTVLEVVLPALDAVPVRVVDSLSADALRDAQLQAERLYGPLRHSIALSVERDPRDPGLHLVRGVGTGLIRLSASAPGHAPALQFVDASEAGPAPWVVSLAPASVLRGRLVDTAGQLVQRGEVLAAADVQGTESSWAPSEHAPAPGGRFELPTLAPGRWMLRARSPGFGETRQTVELTAAGLDDVELVLVRLGTIEGRVVGLRSQSEGRVTFDARHVDTGERRQVQADTAGAFRLDDVQPGTWTFSGARIHDGQVDVLPGQTAWVELTWLPQSRIVGRVVVPGSVPAGSMVYAIEGGSSLRVRGVAIPDQDGAWELVVEADAYIVQAYLPGMGRAASRLVEVAEGETVHVELTPAAHALAGRVVDDLTGEPVAGAQVVTRMPSNPLHAMVMTNMNADAPSYWPITDGAGRFRLESLPAGLHELDVQVPGYVRKRQPDVVVPGSDVEVRLQPATRIKGGVTVRPGGLVAAEGTLVCLFDMDDRYVSSTYTSHGRYRFKGISPGAYRIRVGDGAREGQGTVAWEGAVGAGVEVVIDLRIDG